MASSNEESEEEANLTDSFPAESPKKKKRIRAATKAPSKTKWEDLQDIGIVSSYCDISHFRENVIVARKNAPLIESCHSPELAHFQHCYSVLVKKVSIDNEGFPSAKYTLLFSHLTNHLGDDYNMKIYPVIKKERDRRRNKRSDCTIMKLKNRRTVLVCELKFGLAEEILVIEDEFSQLLQEVRYAYETDTQSSGIRYKYIHASYLGRPFNMACFDSTVFL